MNFDLIDTSMGIEYPNDATENELLYAIADRVAWFMQHDIDMLMSYLYRLDVEERYINKALSLKSTEDPQLALARLILDRQKQRMLTKERYKVTPIEGWEY